MLWLIARSTSWWRRVLLNTPPLVLLIHLYTVHAVLRPTLLYLYTVHSVISVLLHYLYRTHLALYSFLLFWLDANCTLLSLYLYCAQWQQSWIWSDVSLAKGKSSEGFGLFVIWIYTLSGRDLNQTWAVLKPEVVHLYLKLIWIDLKLLYLQTSRRVDLQITLQ